MLEPTESSPRTPDGIRVVVDADVWASGLRAYYPTSPAKAVVGAAYGGIFRVCFTGELLSEIVKGLLKLGETSDDAELVIMGLLLALPDAVIVPIEHQVMGCGDPGDDHLYESAEKSGAIFIVSKDGCVLSPPLHVREYLSARRIELCKPKMFVGILRGILSVASRA